MRDSKGDYTTKKLDERRWTSSWDAGFDDEYGDGGYDGYNERLKLQHDLLSYDEFEYYGHIISLEVTDAEVPYRSGSRNPNWKVNGTSYQGEPYPNLGVYTDNGGVKWNKTTGRWEPVTHTPVRENFACSLWIDGRSYLPEYGALYAKPDYLQRCVKLIIEKCKPKSNPSHLIESTSYDYDLTDLRLSDDGFVSSNRPRYYASQLIKKLIEIYDSGHPGMFLGLQTMFPEPAAGGKRHVYFANKKPVELPYFEEYTEEDSYDDYEVYSAFAQILPEIGKRFNINIVNDLETYDYSNMYPGSDADYLGGEIIDSLEDEMNDDDLEYPYYQEEGIENKRTGGLPRHRVRDAEDMSRDHIKEWFDNLDPRTKSDIMEDRWDEEYWAEDWSEDPNSFPYLDEKEAIILGYDLGYRSRNSDNNEETGSVYNTIDEEEFDEDELRDLNAHKETEGIGDSSSDAEGELYEDIEDDIDEFEVNYRHHEEDPDYQKKYNKLRKKIWKFKGSN